MPAAPKSPKRAGAPKGKGAVRAKSGCYTCRIRRKKCDEKPNADNHCETCVRLRLECLGFGTKRPEWLRDNRNVLAVRDRIKTHLAAQGMIKGHSGAGPRNAEREPPVLRLHDEYPNSTSSASPPTPTLSISSSDDNRRPGLSISSMRDDSYHLQPSLEPYPTGLTPRMQELSPNSPQPSRGPIYANDIMLPPYNITTSASTSIEPDWPVTTSYPPPMEYTSPAIVSSISPTYTLSYEDEYSDVVPNSHVVGHPFELEHIHGNIGYIHLPSIPLECSGLVQHYIQHVVKNQYLLAEKESTRSLMSEALQRSPVALQAACLLSSLVAKSHNHGAAVLESESQDQFSSLITKRNPEEGDAMAGLHIVSWVLFGGGKGQWKDFLNVACRFADSILWSPHHAGPYDALLHCSTMERFIIKTSMWFDVLGAATRVEVPYFLEIFNALFKPDSAYFDNLVVDERLSMLDIMGCENHIVWALAAISHLACWKNQQNATGHLSMPALVKQGESIERYLMPPTSIPETHTKLEQTRLVTSQVFRASARVYLHSVVSGAHPSCTEIKDGVADTISWLERVPANDNRAVVRSVVFSICLCSCLTDDPVQRAFFLQCLDMQDAYLGNCAEVRRLIQDVWDNREPSSPHPVPWQTIMRKTQILLV